MEASFTLLQGTELHTFGPIYMSECFPKETVLNLGIATLLFADAPTGYPKNRKRAGDDSAFFFLPSLPTTQRGLCRGERYSEVMIAQFILNRPFPSSKKSHFQSEAKCEAIDMKMSFNYDANKTYFHNKGFALSLVLKVRFFGTRKWPILYHADIS